VHYSITHCTTCFCPVNKKVDIKLTLPKDLPKQVYKLWVFVADSDGYFVDLDGVLKYQEKNFSIFIQTDKLFYKAGQKGIRVYVWLFCMHLILLTIYRMKMRICWLLQTSSLFLVQFRAFASLPDLLPLLENMDIFLFVSIHLHLSISIKLMKGIGKHTYISYFF